jgi:hypothetical protein
MYVGMFTNQSLTLFKLFQTYIAGSQNIVYAIIDPKGSGFQVSRRNQWHLEKHWYSHSWYTINRSVVPKTALQNELQE